MNDITLVCSKYIDEIDTLRESLSSAEFFGGILIGMLIVITIISMFKYLDVQKDSIIK